MYVIVLIFGQSFMVTGFTAIVLLYYNVLYEAIHSQHTPTANFACFSLYLEHPSSYVYETSQTPIHFNDPMCVQMFV